MGKICARGENARGYTRSAKEKTEHLKYRTTKCVENLTAYKEISNHICHQINTDKGRTLEEIAQRHTVRSEGEQTKEWKLKKKAHGNRHVLLQIVLYVFYLFLPLSVLISWEM